MPELLGRYSCIAAQSATPLILEAKLRLAIAMQAEAAAVMVSKDHLAQAVRDAKTTAQV